ncbi:hypothetical protein PS2_018284 [Malus domestica]
MASLSVTAALSSSVSCLAAATNFKDRCQTTSRPRSSSSNSGSPSVFVLPYKIPQPSILIYTKKKKKVVEQSRVVLSPREKKKRKKKGGASGTT